jgi:glycosyltransferase involved in cell wall biosynthesis
VLGVFLYLFKNAKKIDWLNLYHCRKRTLYWMKFFKFLNPNGYIWLKLDMDYTSCDEMDKDRKYQKTFFECSKAADCISVESEKVRIRLQKYADKEIKVIPDGFYMKESHKCDLEKKDNIFITVGRLGIKQKATENLLEAFAQCKNVVDWKLRLVGTVDKSFQSYITKFMSENPDLSDRVTFVGQITDREILAEEYSRAKVFVLPSRWESFGIAVLEAMSEGCYVVLTDAVPPAEEFTKNETYGKIVAVDDIRALSDAMVQSAQMNIPSGEISNYVNEHFLWKEICNRISQILNEYA